MTASVSKHCRTMWLVRIKLKLRSSVRFETIVRFGRKSRVRFVLGSTIWSSVRLFLKFGTSLKVQKVLKSEKKKLKVKKIFKGDFLLFWRKKVKWKIIEIMTFSVVFVVFYYLCSMNPKNMVLYGFWPLKQSKIW